ncbi:hypothetical protein OHA72_37595 [Dactylosporangium sp. NBC_01737]|uniref:hypothetical protein n=1 Tax=Dactylosporangium sp. NBC_01737 TaxID=2975959 RepID=UPI002E13ECF4|nr:hypothetical protein OHA72_37595 [Dactylosporangium sp. NBC_01737]
MPAWLARLAPIVSLALFAPWVAEYLVGSHTVVDLPLIVFLVPLYGGGALLVRELARRTGRGWPTILLLGLAYGVIEAGLIDQSLFNPSYQGQDFQSIAHVPGLSMSAFWGMVFIAGHAIWSIGAPIAFVESFLGARRHAPWTNGFGLALVALLYLLGCWLVFADLRSTEGFQASPLQLGAAAVTAVALIVAAFAVQRRAAPVRVTPSRLVAAPHATGRLWPPHWGVVLGLSFVASLVLWIPGTWLGVACSAVLLGGATVLALRWSRSRRWSPVHVLAIADGALLTYAVNGFNLHPWRRLPHRAEVLSDVTFAVVTVALVALSLWWQRRRWQRMTAARSLHGLG